MPQIVNALLSRHNFILLGLRDRQSRELLRALTTLLDPAMPSSRSEVNRQSLCADLQVRKNLVNEAGDDTPIAWLQPDQRYVEKLATPDVTVATSSATSIHQAARGGHILGDELTMHYGMLRGQIAESLPERASRPCRKGAGQPLQHHAGG